MTKRLERETLQADLSAVESLLEGTPEEDVFARINLEYRRDEIEKELSKIDKSASTLGEVALIFYGDPVFGSRSIDAKFSAEIIREYQEIISKQIAYTCFGQLGKRGRIPKTSAPSLNISNIVHGSFGFILEEKDIDEPPMFDSPTKYAMELTSDLMENLGNSKEDNFKEALEKIDSRTFVSIRDFFKTLHSQGATLNILGSSKKIVFERESIERASLRLNETHVEDDDFTLTGVLIGILPLQRRFEFQSQSTGEIFRGDVGPKFSREFLERIKNERVVGKLWEAVFEMKTVTRPKKDPEVFYKLLDLNEVSD